MKRFHVAACVLLLSGVLAGRADAQLGGTLGGLSLAVEVVPTLGLGLGDFGAGDPGPAAGTGFGFEAGASLGLGRSFGIYGDYQYMTFDCGECEEFGLDSRTLDVGFEGGVQLGVPLSLMGTRPWVRAGVVGHQLQFSDPEASATSDLSIGFGVGAGVDLPLAGGLALSPSIRYRTYSAEFASENPIELGTTVSYLAASVGLSYHF